jgi:hypothetical protein
MRRRIFADVPAEITARRYALKFELHSELARLSKRGMLLRAEHSGHDIPEDEPARVIEAIRIVVDAVRTRRTHSAAAHSGSPSEAQGT